MLSHEQSEYGMGVWGHSCSTLAAHPFRSCGATAGGKGARLPPTAGMGVFGFKTHPQRSNVVRSYNAASAAYRSLLGEYRAASAAYRVSATNISRCVATYHSPTGEYQVGFANISSAVGASQASATSISSTVGAYQSRQRHLAPHRGSPKNFLNSLGYCGTSVTFRRQRLGWFP